MITQTASKEISVLIVDDNKFIVQRLAGMLDELEQVWNIQTANSYEEAIHQFNMHKYDVVLLDINLPGKSGISILKTVRQAGFAGKVIMLSNFTEQFYKDRCMMLGASLFLDKTADFDKLPYILAGVA